MENGPEISIIIPTLNEERYIGRLLGSIKGQDFKKHEIIICDYNSEDRTAEIARNHGAVVLNCPKKGPAAQRNHGANKAKGKHLVFLDADTRIPPNTLDIIKKHIDNGKIGGSFPVKYWDANLRDTLASKFFNALYIVGNSCLPVGYGPCMFFNKKAFMSVNGFSKKVIYEDNEIARRMFFKLGKK